MDPNANLAEQEALVLKLRVMRKCKIAGRYELERRLQQLREDLASWLASGGFAPEWSKAPNAALYWARQIGIGIKAEPEAEAKIASYLSYVGPPHSVVLVIDCAPEGADIDQIFDAVLKTRGVRAVEHVATFNSEGAGRLVPCEIRVPAIG